MRALVVICLVAGCGDTGLLLDIKPGTADVTSVEVFLPKDVAGDHMGMPPAATQKTSGTVYAVADHVTAAVTGGSVSILLKPGSLDSVPALLVLGYNANHVAVRYAVVSDPNGALQLPPTKENTIKVELDPIAQVPVGASTMGPANGPRLARWSHTMLDDPNGDCIAVLTDNTRGGYDGDFFGPGDDLDCDAAMPECDDTWYLKVGTANTPPQNPLCARDDATPDTMDACRIGDTVACTDNIGDCKPRTMPIEICAPAAVCNQCTDQIDASCFMSGITADSTPYVECDLPVGDGGSGSLTLCSGTNATTIGLDLTLQLADTYSIVAAEFDAPPAITGGTQSLPLAGATTTTLHVTTVTGSRGLTFLAENGATPGIDSGLPDTHALLVVGVHSGGTRALVLPFLAHYVNDCQMTPSCRLVIGEQNGQPFNDPIWHCAGK